MHLLGALGARLQRQHPMTALYIVRSQAGGAMSQCNTNTSKSPTHLLGALSARLQQRRRQRQRPPRRHRLLLVLPLALLPVPGALLALVLPLLQAAGRHRCALGRALAVAVPATAPAVQ